MTEDKWDFEKWLDQTIQISKANADEQDRTSVSKAYWRGRANGLGDVRDWLPEYISAEERAVLDAAQLCVESGAVPGSINYTYLGTAMHKAYYKKPTVRSVIKETIDTYANAADLPAFIESRLRAAGFIHD